MLHIGLAVERDYFAVEQSACRDRYHQYPDVDRQVIPKAEIQKIWGKKSAERFETSLDLERVVEAWKINLKFEASNKGKKSKHQKKLDQGDQYDVRLSDDVGDYVCGLVYYTSMAELAKRGDGAGNAVFLQVPPLNGDEELAKGERVVLALIMALAQSFQ